MKKKLIPALVGAAVAGGFGAAQAETSLSISGFAHAQLEGVEATGATNPAQDKPMRSRVSNVSSELAFKGSTVLSPDVKAVFAYVTGVSVDNANNNTNGGLWANAKDSYVGLAFTDIGTLKLGRMTGAARWNSGSADFSFEGAGPQDDQSVLSGASGQTGASPLFNVRLDNAVGFESASFGGFSFRGYYSANENRSARTVATGALLNDASYSGLLRYVIGPVDVRLSQEVRHDKGTLNNSTTDKTQDKDTRFGLRYTLPTATVLAIGYDHMSFGDSTATGTAKRSLRKSGWVVSADQPFGKHTLFAAYGQAPDLHVVLANGAAADTSHTGAKELVLGYQYSISKQAAIEAYYSQLDNQSQGKYDFDSGGIGPGTGASLRAFGAGLRYEF
jgi:predicted porin